MPDSHMDAVEKKFTDLALHNLLIATLIACCPLVLNAQEMEFTVHTDKPAIGRGASGTWDRGYVDPGTVVFHDGAFHMFYNAIPSWPHALAIGYAKSLDGREWVRQSDNPVLIPDQAGALPTISIMSNSAMVTQDGLWVLYFASAAPNESFYGQIARATAPGPLGPWTIDPEPVLMPGPDGAWDGISVGDASVVRTEDGYAMYYTGFGEIPNGTSTEKRANIGMATSKNGLDWEKFNDPETTGALWGASDPVFSFNMNEDGWDTYRVLDPSVQKTSEGWIMAYQGAASKSPRTDIGIAVSQDGVSWVRTMDKPMISNKELGKKIFFITMLSRPKQDYLFMEMGSNDSTQGYLATRPRVNQ